MTRKDDAYWFVVSILFKGYLHHLWFKHELGKTYINPDTDDGSKHELIHPNLFHAILNLNRLNHWNKK